MRLTIKEIVRIIGRQVGTFKSANNYIWAAGRHFNICRYYYSGRQVGAFIIADIFFIQVGTLKFADISLQVGRSALLTMLIIH
jgi:hypothetical protein